MLYTNPPKQEKKLKYRIDIGLANRSTGKLISYLEVVISGERRGLLTAILRFALLQISWICLGIVKLRRFFYSRGFLLAKHLPCKVISIGNIVAGGSGKTPAVITTARIIRENTGLSVAILSRGYRSKVRGPAVVSDGVETGGCC